MQSVKRDIQWARFMKNVEREVRRACFRRIWDLKDLRTIAVGVGSREAVETIDKRLKKEREWLTFLRD